jgi:predicted O-linked N-acetylglucosamine transferase (SPINDLY family)
MHMPRNRLLVFARRPAPIQVTYLAYPGTTGLDSIDYRITDGHLDPPGTSDQYYSEKSVRLGSYWCYEEPWKGLENTFLPAERAGYVTFGCLGNFCKVNPPVLKTWSDILLAVPGSRLLLHADEGSHREGARRILSEWGVDPHRLIFVGKLPLPAYLEQYHGIDIGLDPFPYVGGTTTCDALWMGVPVVTLRGRTAIGRGGVSILSTVGLAEFIGDTPEQYVQIAVGWANDLGRLSGLRATLRKQMRSSPLMDAQRFARDLESALRRMWIDWVSGSAT